MRRTRRPSTSPSATRVRRSSPSARITAARHARRARAASASSRPTITGDVEGMWLRPGDEMPEDEDVVGRGRLRGRASTSEPALVAALVVEAPFAPLHDEDCAGLCATCGADLNVGALRVRRRRPTTDHPFAALKELLGDEDADEGRATKALERVFGVLPTRPARVVSLPLVCEPRRSPQQLTKRACEGRTKTEERIETMAVPKRKTGRAKTNSRRSSPQARRRRRSRRARSATAQAAAPRVPRVRLLQRQGDHRDRVVPVLPLLHVAVSSVARRTS